GADADRKADGTTVAVRQAGKACEEGGLVLESMMIPIDFYRQARLGQSGRDQEIDNVCRTIRAAGDEGVPLLEWRFWPDFYWDERVGYYTAEGRGGAGCKAVAYGRVKGRAPLPGSGEGERHGEWQRGA